MSTRRMIVSAHAGKSVILMDSISYAGPSDRDVFAVSASHGGRSSADIASTLPLAGVVFNDAGVGKDEAGIAGLAVLDEKGMPALTVGHETAHIGDVVDAWSGGTISHVNDAAQRLGFAPGQRMQDAVLAWFETATKGVSHIKGSDRDGR